ncbi:MAG: hypothetical protein M3M95_05070 [Pseudomonadota bacterium]|nr:hypothetical protein [Pseudomonadota bacterium]
MLIALALAAAAQTASPPPPRLGGDPKRPCAREGLEHARNAGVIYRHGDRPAEYRDLGELPDADMILTLYRRDGRGCPILDVVRLGVSTPEEPPIVGVPLRRTPSLPRPERRPQRQP